MENFEFLMPGRIVFGAGKLKESGNIFSEVGSRALIACDAWIKASGLAEKLSGILKDKGIDSVIYDKVIPNPTSTLIDSGAEVARNEKCNFVIGLGGGSSMDTAKGIAVAATHPGGIWEYAIGKKAVTADTLPIVAITTTSGTGSQCTTFAVISNSETKQKPGMGSPHILPSLAIVDPELMLSASPRLTASTGFDVFCHAVEAYTSNASSELSDMYAEKALRLVGRHLPECWQNGQNLEARSGMALADTCAGTAICNAVVTLGHVIGHVISGHYPDISHGDALYSIYREILKFNSKVLPDKNKFSANAIEPGNDDIVSAFDNFFSRFRFENRLKEKNLDARMIEKLAADTFTYMKGVAELNPVPANEKDVIKIIEDSLKTN